MQAHAQHMLATPGHYPLSTDSGGRAEPMDNSKSGYLTHSFKDVCDNVNGLNGAEVSDTVDGGRGIFVATGGGLSDGVAQWDQLTLSFRGDVYVFDSVTEEKVQAVLMLLQGHGISPCDLGVDAVYQNHRSTTDHPIQCSDPKRAESLVRYRQKRKERCYQYKVRYGVRQEVAKRMHRKKGQFACKNSEESNLSDAEEEPRQDANQLETFCKHCGVSSKSTPMMRRGPSGPRTFCNACGLIWANKGTLRDLSRGSQHIAMDLEDEDDYESDYPSVQPHHSYVSFSSGEASVF